MTTTIYEPPERVDDLADRVSGGVLPVDAALLEACRVAVAEELRRIVNDTTYGWAIGERLMARADALDPEGAQR